MQIRNLFDPGSGIEKFGSGINIPDPQHWCCGPVGQNVLDLYLFFLVRIIDSLS